MSSIQLPALLDSFYGRASYLQRLRDGLSAKGSVFLGPKDERGPFCLGATQLALKYAQDFGADYQSIFFIGASSELMLDLAYYRMAHALGLDDALHEKAGKTRQVIRDYLGSHDDYLIIFDGILQMNYLRDFLPPTPQGHLVFTGNRFQKLPFFKGQKINLTPLDLKEAHGLLKAELAEIDAVEFTDSVGEALADCLSAHPLALQQAICFLKAEKTPISAYLDALNGAKKRLFKGKKRGKGEAYNPSRLTIDVALSLLEKKEKGIRTWVDHLAIYPRDIIPKALLKPAPGAENSPIRKHDIPFTRACTLLQRYGLLQGSFGPAEVQFHSATRHFASDEWAEQHLMAAIHIIAAEIDTEMGNGNVGSGEAFDHRLAQVLGIFDHPIQAKIRRYILPWLAKIALHYGNRAAEEGLFDVARPLIERGLDWSASGLEAFGDIHIKSLAYLAQICRHHGEAEAAASYEAAQAEFCERYTHRVAEGALDLPILSGGAPRAGQKGEAASQNPSPAHSAGDSGAGLSWAQALLVELRAEIESEGSAVAFLSERVGDGPAAETTLLGLLDMIHLELKGGGDGDGDGDLAIAHLMSIRAILTLLSERQGLDRLAQCTLLFQSGDAFMAGGHVVGAEMLYDGLLERLRGTQDENCPLFDAILGALATVALQTHGFEKAIAALKERLQRIENRVGPEDLQTLEAYLALGAAYRRYQALDQAVETYLVPVQRLESAKNTNNMLYIRGVGELGDLLFAQNRYHDALKLYDEVMETWPQVVDQDVEIYQAIQSKRKACLLCIEGANAWPNRAKKWLTDLFS